MVLDENEEKMLEMWQVANLKVKAKELYETWKNLVEEIEGVNEEIEDVETDFLKQLRQSAPIEWKHNINVNTTLTKYNRFKKVLWALYRPIENGEIVRIVKEFEEKIIDNRRKLINFLAQITSDSEEQYQLLYFYCWSKELKEHAVKPHQSIKDVRKRKEKEEKVKKVIELRRKGLSIRKIAEIVGLSKSTVQRILSKVENKND